MQGENEQDRGFKSHPRRLTTSITNECHIMNDLSNGRWLDNPPDFNSDRLATSVRPVGNTISGKNRSRILSRTLVRLTGPDPDFGAMASSSLRIPRRTCHPWESSLRSEHRTFERRRRESKVPQQLMEELGLELQWRLEGSRVVRGSAVLWLQACR